MSVISNTGTISGESMAQAVLQLHIAEYQNLTTRCDYWITIQVALLPLFFVVIGMVATMWSSIRHPALLAWGGLLVIEMIVINWLRIGAEIYNAVTYVECELRPLIRSELVTPQTLVAVRRDVGVLAELQSAKIYSSHAA